LYIHQSTLNRSFGNAVEAALLIGRESRASLEQTRMA
jgi:hypothetical protein